MAAVERDLLDGLPGDHKADGARRAIDERRFCAHDDGLARFADSQMKLMDERAADLERQPLDDLGFEVRRLRGDLIEPGRDRGDRIPSIAIGRG